MGGPEVSVAPKPKVSAVAPSFLHSLRGYAALTTAESAPYPPPNSRSLRSRPQAGSQRRPAPQIRKSPPSSPPCGCGSHTARLQPQKSAVTLPRGSGSRSARPQPWKSADPGLPCCVRRSAFSVGDWQWSPSGWASGAAGPALGSAGSGRSPWSSVK